MEGKIKERITKCVEKDSEVNQAMQNEIYLNFISVASDT